MADGNLKNMTPADEVQHFIDQCSALAALPCSAETAPKFRALQAEEVTLRKRLDATRVAEKEPHLSASRAVDAKYQPLIGQLQDAVKAVTRALTAFLAAEEARKLAEAAEARRKAAEEAARAAALAKAAEEEADPFEAFEKAEAATVVEAQAATLAKQAAEPVRARIVGEEGGRAASLRIVGWLIDVEDAPALVAHYAHRSEMIDLAKKLAAAEAKAAKGQCTIPGAKITADRRAA